MKTRILIPTVLIALLVTSSSVFAWGGGNHRGDNCPGPGFQGTGHGHAAVSMEQHQAMAKQRIERMTYMLNLTDDQQKQLTDLFDQQWQARQTLRTKMQASRDMLMAMQAAPEFNEKEFRAEAQKQADMKTEMMVQRATMKQKINALLTPEQQEKAKTLLPGQGQGPMGKRFADCDGDGPHGDMMGHGNMMGHRGQGRW